MNTDPRTQLFVELIGALIQVNVLTGYTENKAELDSLKQKETKYIQHLAELALGRELTEKELYEIQN